MLELSFDAPSDGRFRVTANLTKANDYGTYRLAINGVDAAFDIDRYHPEVKNDDVEIGTFDLKKSGNRFQVTIVGAHPEAIKRYMFGLDYLLLKSVE